MDDQSSHSGPDLFLKKIDSSLEENELVSILERFGELEYAHFNHSDRFHRTKSAMIKFHNRGDALKCRKKLNGVKLRGYYLDARVYMESFPEGASIIVKNLSEKVNAQKLEQYFSDVGDILAAKVKIDDSGKSTCQGTVIFDCERTASRAISMKNFTIWKSSFIEINRFYSKENRIQAQESANLYVIGFPHEYTNEDLCNKFQIFGDIKRVKIMEKRGSRGKRIPYAYVEFHNQEHAYEAIREMNLKQEHNFYWKVIEYKNKIARMKDTQEEEKEREERLKLTCIALIGISSQTNKNELTEIFNKFGDIENIEIIHARRVAYVTYWDPESAETAINKVNTNDESSFPFIEASMWKPKNQLTRAYQHETNGRFNGRGRGRNQNGRAKRPTGNRCHT